MTKLVAPKAETAMANQASSQEEAHAKNLFSYPYPQVKLNRYDMESRARHSVPDQNQQ
jgi:hypothetical protein